MSDGTELQNYEEPDRALGSEEAAGHIQTNQEEIREDNGTVKVRCDPCKTENESSEAAGFCEECSEFLCKNCLKVHKRLTVTRDHTIKEGSENLANGARNKYQKKPNLCPIHTDMELKYFCQTHDELSCSTCNSIIHTNCKNVENVSALCCRTDFDTELREIEAEMDCLLTNVDDTSYKVKVSLDAVQLNHDEASARIKKVRTEVNNHLDQLQSNVQHKIDGLKKDDSQKMKKYGEKCNAMRFEVDSLRKKLKGTSAQNSQYDKYMALRSAQCLIRSSWNQLLEIRKSTGVNRYYFKPDQELYKLKTLLQKFGDIDLDSNRIKTAKYIKSFTLKGQDSEIDGHITGIEVVDVNQIVTVDSRNKTMSLIHTTEHTILSSVGFETSPWSVALLSDNILAVTLPEQKKIAKVEKTKENCLILIKDQDIAVDWKCYGLAARCGKLFVQFSVLERTLITVLNETGTVLKTLKEPEGYDIPRLQKSHTAIDPECKYMVFIGKSKYTDRSLAAVSLEDGKITKIHSFIGGSEAITIDRTGTLFYCEYDGIYCFLRGGPKTSKAISDRMYSKSVTSLAYCNKQNVLFVALKQNEIKMYYVV